MSAVLITGGGRGNGRATSLLCAARGWNVGINYRSDHDAAEATAEAVRKAGSAAAVLPGDMADGCDVAQVFADCEAALGVPEEVAEAIVQLLNDAARYATGTFIDVTGGP